MQLSYVVGDETGQHFPKNKRNGIDTQRTVVIPLQRSRGQWRSVWIRGKVRLGNDLSNRHFNPTNGTFSTSCSVPVTCCWTPLLEHRPLETVARLCINLIDFVECCRHWERQRGTDTQRERESVKINGIQLASIARIQVPIPGDIQPHHLDVELES